MKELCDMANMEDRTMADHPMDNHIAERFNATLHEMLGTLDLKIDWYRHLESLGYAYNCTKHDITGFSPYY